jgi:hypothetical protein
MLAGSNPSQFPDPGRKKGEPTTSPTISAKLSDYVAEQNLHAPALRVFKQVERKQGQTFYHRSLFGGLAGFAFLASLGAFGSFYFGFSILASILLCSTIGFIAMNVWLNKSIPEVKISACASQPAPCKPALTEEVSPQSPNILFRGVSYPIKHEPTSALLMSEEPYAGKKPRA